MLELIAAVCRAIASDAKLLLLYQMARQGELNAAELASRTHLAPDGVSHHTQRLSAVGLVERRRSGAHVFCRLATTTRGELGVEVAALVQRACRDSRWATSGWGEEGTVHLLPETVAQVGQAAALPFDVIFDAATAFGNVRRLQLIRLILRSGPCSEDRIVTELRMSPAACRRHTDKLSRRGVLSRRGSKSWVLSRSRRTPFHAALMSLVVARLRE